MAKPKPVGPWVDGYHRYWWGERGPYLSVTTATSVLDKPGVDTWRVNETAKYAIEHAATLAALTQQEAYRAIKSATEAIRVDSAEFGTTVHDLIDQWVKGNEHPIVAVGSDEEKFLYAFGTFLHEYGVKRSDFLRHELAVFNDKLMTAGRVDGILAATPRIATELGVEVGDPGMIDYKSGKGTYGDTALQLGGYTDMEYSGYPDDPNPHRLLIPRWHAVLHIRPHEYEGGHPEDFKLVPYSVTSESIDLFRACVKLKRWQQEQDRIYRASKKAA